MESPTPWDRAPHPEETHPLSGEPEALSLTRRTLLGAVALATATLSGAMEAPVTARPIASAPPVPPVAPSEPTALESLNELIAGPWTYYQEQFVKEIRKSLRARSISVPQSKIEPLSEHAGSELKGWYRLSVEHLRLSIDPDLSAPFGFTEIASEALTIAFPLAPGAGWSARIGARFDLKLEIWLPKRRLLFPAGYTTISVPLQAALSLKRLRLVLRVPLSGDPDRPRIGIAELREESAVEVSGLAEETAEVLRSENTSQVSATIRLKGVTGKATSLPVGVTDAAVVVDVDVTVAPRLEIRVAGELRYALPGKKVIRKEISHTLLLTEDLVGLPRDWGEAGAVLPRAPASDFLAPALAAERAILTHLPHGLLYDIRYDPPADPVADGRREPHPPRSPRSGQTRVSPRTPAPGPGAQGAGASPKPNAYVGFPDTAIWTGHYLAAEAFRYQVCARREANGRENTAGGHQEARERALYVLSGIEKLFQVTGVPGLMARCALPDHSPLQTDPPLNLPKNPNVYKPVVLKDSDPAVPPATWRGYGRGQHPVSRDQYIGVLLGLAFAHEFVPEARSRTKQLIRGMLSFLEANQWNVIIPGDDTLPTTFLVTWHHRLAFLRVGATLLPNEFAEPYERAARAAPAVWISPWTDCLDPINKYYKFNLNHATLGLLLYLESGADASSRVRRAGYQRAFDIQRRTIRHHQNAYFHLVRLLTEPDEGRRHWIMEHEQETNTGLTLGEEIRSLLAQWLERSRSVTGPAGLPSQKTPHPERLQALFPDQVALYGRIVPAVSPEAGVEETAPVMAATTPVPVPLRPGFETDFMWQRAPFLTDLRLDPKPS
jgi:hypothetical protein